MLVWVAVDRPSDDYIHLSILDYFFCIIFIILNQSLWFQNIGIFKDVHQFFNSLIVCIHTIRVHTELFDNVSILRWGISSSMGYRRILLHFFYLYFERIEEMCIMWTTVVGTIFFPFSIYFVSFSIVITSTMSFLNERRVVFFRH